MKTLCVILARAGSKGLSGKNQRFVAGRPMIAWTIQHAQEAQRLDRIVVSTDGQEIARIASRLGVHVIERPAQLANDTATVDSAARHAVQCVEQDGGSAFERVVILYGNVPLRPKGLIDRAVQRLETTGADSVQSVCPVGKCHPYWMTTLGGQDADVLLPFRANQVYRRQDLPPVYQIDGGVIAVTRASLFVVDPDRPHAFLGHDRRGIRTEPGQVLDVDDQRDWLLADVLLRRQFGDSGQGVFEGMSAS